MTTTGTAESAPNKVGAPYIDYATGLNAAFAITAALHQQRLSGDAMYIDVSMLDSSMLLMSSMLTQAMSLGMQHEANGNEAFSRSPSSGTFATQSGQLSIAANNERQFRSLCSGLEREDILTDSRWSTPKHRVDNQQSLREIIVSTLMGKTAQQWEDIFSELAVPAARVRSINEVLSEPQLAERGLMHAVPMAGSDQPAHVPTLGFKVDGASTAPQKPPPSLGQHSREILREIGVDDSTFDDLVRRQVVG